ncbi:MAG: hypothetical protein ACK5AM_12410, partial [Pirellulaceae bacterium]
SLVNSSKNDWLSWLVLVRKKPDDSATVLGDSCHPQLFPSQQQATKAKDPTACQMFILSSDG